MQLAVVERGETLQLEASTSGRGDAAAPYKELPGGRAREEASRQLSWAQQRAGLLDGLGMDAVLWGLMSESHQALLSTCTDVVSHADDRSVTGACGCKIDSLVSLYMLIIERLKLTILRWTHLVGWQLIPKFI